jgi:anthranilate phosphoribosyltransferase
MDIHYVLNKLIEKKDLTEIEMEQMTADIFSGNVSPVLISSILTALRIKEESIDEITGSIHAMRTHMTHVKSEGVVIDTCGTGGDGSGTFNISTAVAFVAAGAGIQVAKHGNRNASSQCGSADVLEALGVNIQLNADQAATVLQDCGIVFLFAPLFHPGMKHVGPIRKELKIRTIFNFLGPFCNPVEVKRQIIGVPDFVIAQKLAQVATHLDYENLMIVTGSEGLDEISLVGKSHLFYIHKKQIEEIIIDPKQYGLQYANAKELQGGTAMHNAEILLAILEGEKGPKRNIVLLNSAVALVVAEKVKNIEEGLKLASEAIDSGKAKEKLEGLIIESNKFFN